MIEEISETMFLVDEGEEDDDDDGTPPGGGAEAHHPIQKMKQKTVMGTAAC